MHIKISARLCAYNFCIEVACRLCYLSKIAWEIIYFAEIRTSFFGRKPALLTLTKRPPCLLCAYIKFYSTLRYYVIIIIIIYCRSGNLLLDQSLKLNSCSARGLILLVTIGTYCVLHTVHSYKCFYKRNVHINVEV